MSDRQDLYEELKKNDRYFLAILAAFVLGLLLVFYKDLQPWLQRDFVPALVVYLLGAALIAQVQNMAGIRERRRCEAEGKPFRGSPVVVYRSVIVAHVVWFGCWVLFLLARLWPAP
jgi:hypothetical protein